MEKTKSFLEILLTPLAIALVGTVGTILVTNQQIKSAQLSRLTEIESTEKLTKSDQQIKIIEIFSQKITSTEIREREIAVRILSALDPALAEKLITAIAENSKEDTAIQNIATNLQEELQTQPSFVVLGSHKTLSEAKKQIDSLSKKKLSYRIGVYLSENGYYAVCLGDRLTFKEAKAVIKYVRQNGIVPDVYIRTSNEWTDVAMN